ncbi:NADP-dependent oxidoreductase [Streptomyces parvulus]|uniref:NADP-dependent oxidoreductase n=1 Tax=Streptomyces parvulus TaxID=146923 RepID=UPI0033FEC6C4
MKALRYHDYGGSDVLVLEDVEVPAPGPGQVLVRVAATSFNPLDAALRTGRMSQVLPLVLPHTPGVDLSGTVSALGPDTTGWSEGDAVIGYLPPTIPGASAQYVLAPAEVLTAAPRTVPLADAAALPVAGLSAWQALFDHAQLTAGQRILINGAAGAVGRYAVQLAHQAGAHVTATASPRSTDRVRALGADRLIDYTTTPVTEAAARDGFDTVVNIVPNSPEEVAALIGLINDGGTFVSATTPAPAEPGRSIRTIRMASASRPSQLAHLVDRIDAGELHIDVADRRPLAQAAEVHHLADQGRLPGKTIITA